MFIIKSYNYIVKIDLNDNDAFFYFVVSKNYYLKIAIIKLFI